MPEKRLSWSPQESTNLGCFQGFARPQSNATYTPNQFFDVVVRNSKNTGIIRAVAYLIRQTLGWCDPNGNPQEVQILGSYQHFIKKAGIARSRVAEAVSACLESGYFKEIRQAQPSTPGNKGSSGLYELLWDEKNPYTTDVSKFHGFFAGNGNRTFVPNEFFDVVIPNEKLGIIKVVGVLFRDTIGFQNKFGHRRTQVSRSTRDIARLTGLSHSRAHCAIREAVDKGYIVCLDQGHFDFKGSAESRSATYGVHWEDSAQYYKTSPKLITDETGAQSDTGPKLITEISGSQFEPGPKLITGTSPKLITKNQSQIDNHLKREQKKTTFKKQQHVGDVSSAVAKNIATHDMLLEVGFDQNTANHLIKNHPEEVIAHQIEWLPFRKVRSNKLGFLRKAIEGNYEKPQTAGHDDFENSNAKGFAQKFYIAFAKRVEEAPVDPSINDYNQAESFVERLLAICPDTSQVEKWAEGFGKRCGSIRQGKGTYPSLVNFIRLQGNQFAEDLERSVTQSAKAEATEQRTRHEERYKPLWLAYLNETEKEFRIERKGDYERFMEQRTTEREAITEKRGETPFSGLIDQWLQAFDSEESRLRAFQEYFSSEVGDFTDWARAGSPKH